MASEFLGTIETLPECVVASKNYTVSKGSAMETAMDVRFDVSNTAVS